MAYHIKPHRHAKPNGKFPVADNLTPRYAVRYRQPDDWKWTEKSCLSLELAIHECNGLTMEGYEVQLMILFDFKPEAINT